MIYVYLDGVALRVRSAGKVVSVPALGVVGVLPGGHTHLQEFRRRVKTQSSLPSEDAAVVLLFSLVASGQIKLRRIDGWQKIAAVRDQHMAVKLTRVALTVGFVLSILAGPLAAEAQPAGNIARLGVLLFSTPAADRNLPAFLAGLRDLGYVEGRNVVLEYRYAEGQPERVSELALQVASLKPDVIVVLGGDMVRFVKDATATVPVVMLTSLDPVEGGVIASFARPGGNLTGVAFVSSETAGKRLQFLKEAVPSLTRVAVLWTPDHPDGEYRNTEATARRLGIHIQSLEVRRPGDFDGAFQAAMRERAEALVVASSRLMNSNRSRVEEFASKQRIPLVTGWGPWARGASLMSYGPDLDTLARRAATHVDKILKGAKPADLPVEQPTKFELVINMRTAKALGLTIPPSLLLRADQIVE